MTALVYRLVYDVRNDPLVDWGNLGGTIAIAGVAWVIRTVAKRGEQRGVKEFKFGLNQTWSPGDLRVFATAIAVACLGLGGLMAVVEYVGHARLRSALEEGTYTEVEGVVANFRASPRDRETWTVESRGRQYEYSYSTYVNEFAYQQTQSHGGQIRDGLRVRIADVDGKIARLEIIDK